MKDNQKILLLVGMNERAMDVACAGPLRLPVCGRQAIVLHGGVIPSPQIDFARASGAARNYFGTFRRALARGKGK